MSKYGVIMENPKSGQTEAYIATCKNEKELKMFLELFESVGYSILSYKNLNK